MSADPIHYENDEELENIWMNGYQKKMNEARSSNDVEEEFKMQQELYTKYSNLYDNALRLEKFSGPIKLAAKINEICGITKDIMILDYGCGTGLVAEQLVEIGFTNIHGTDCNKSLLAISEKKNTMSKLILSRDVDGLKDIASNTYDVVCSSGVFFLSNTHPGTDCYEELCRITKKGGKLIILTKDAYLSQPYVDFDLVDKLAKNGILKPFPKQLFEGYRKPFEFEKDAKSMGAFLIYEIL